MGVFRGLTHFRTRLLKCRQCAFGFVGKCPVICCAQIRQLLLAQVQQYPIINCDGCPNCAPGTFDVAVTVDGHYAFVANEYGQLPSSTSTTETGGGTTGVIKVERDGAGRFMRGTKPVEDSTLYVPNADPNQL